MEIESINVDNKLELLKFTSEVQSRIRSEISSDFVLAKLGDQDKEGIVELTGDAYFIQKILRTIKRAKKWHWNNKTKTWYKTELTDKEKEYIEEISQATFDAFMTRIYMTVILNRNVKDNHILKILAGLKEEEEENTEIENMKAKISELIKPEEKEK